MDTPSPGPLSLQNPPSPEIIDHLSFPSSLVESLAESSTAQSPPERPLLKDRLYVGNLHPTVDEYSLLQIFSKFGKVTKLDFLFHKTGTLKGKPRGYAFIEYGSSDEAMKALNMAHEKLLRGRKLVVTFAHQAPPDHAGTGGPKRRSMMEAGRPTTLSLLKAGVGSKNDGTRDKIAMMEAKLRQMESTNPKPAHTPSSTAVSTSRAPSTTTPHPSLPLKPPPALPESLAAQIRQPTKPRVTHPPPPTLKPRLQAPQIFPVEPSRTSAAARPAKSKLIGVKIGKPKDKEKVAPSDTG